MKTRITKDYDKQLRDAIKHYVQVSATTHNYIAYSKIDNICEQIILGSLFNKLKEFNEYEIDEDEIDEFKQLTKIKIFEKIIKNHHYKKVDNLVNYIFILSKNNLLDFFKGINVRKKIIYTINKIQINFNEGKYDDRDYIFNINEEDEIFLG